MVGLIVPPFRSLIGVGNAWSLDFDGGADYGNIITSGMSAPLSLFGWFKFDTLGSQDCLFAFDAQAANGTRLELDAGDTTKLTFHKPGTGQTRCVTGTISADAWMSIGMTWDGSGWSSTQPKYFKDGGQAAYDSQTGSAVPISATAMTLAKQTGFLDGHCAAMAIWDAEMGASELTELHSAGAGAALDANFGNYVSSVNLKHHWAIEEGTGDTVADEQGAADISLISSPPWSNDVPT